MRAKDDAASQPRAVRSRAPRYALGLVGAVLGALFAIALAPASLARFEVRLPWAGAALSDADWPRPAGPGETAEVQSSAGGQQLVVHAPEAPAAEALARELVAHQSGAIPALRETERTLLESWRTSVQQGPGLPMTRDSEVAALLQAEAAVRRDLALQLPGPYSAAPATTLPVPSVEVLECQQALTLALPVASTAQVESVLLATAAAESEWMASAGVAGSDARERGSAWRRWQLARADSLDASAARLLADESALQQRLAAWQMPFARARLGESRASAYLALARAQSPPHVPAATPIVGVWASLLSLGAVLGAAAALLGDGLAGVHPIARRGAAISVGRDPATTEAWLHVVAGADGTAVTRAVLELAAHGLARRERVLVVDASPRWALHARLGREARWGLMECLHCDMPVLGLVQYGGWPGLYLLAHGEIQRAAGGWSGLGRRLDEARPHFGRVLLCVDRGVARELGESIQGRAVEGWWAGTGSRLPEHAETLTGRLGIAFSCIDLSHFNEVSLERLGSRAAALTPPTPQPALAQEPARERVPESPVELAHPAALEPVVLDCDLQVRHRLRFLAWMRRVQSESRREELEPVS